MNYGFVKPVIESDHYILGAANSLPKIVLQADRKWKQFAPDYEPQAEKFETWGCTVWGTQNAEETLERRVFGNKPNYSERFQYNLCGINPPGGDPHKVAESIRNQGMVDQELLPMTDSLEEFTKPRPVTDALLYIGQEWLNHKDFGHEWLFVGGTTDEVRKIVIREALQYSPIGVSVTAWYKSEGVYVDLGQPNNHWCVLLEEADNGWLIMDSYDQTFKVLSYSHKIEFAKRYSLKERVAAPTPATIPQCPVLNWFGRMLKLKS